MTSAVGPWTGAARAVSPGSSSSIAVANASRRTPLELGLEQRAVDDRPLRGAAQPAAGELRGAVGDEHLADGGRVVGRRCGRPTGRCRGSGRCRPGRGARPRRTPGTARLIVSPLRSPRSSSGIWARSTRLRSTTPRCGEAHDRRAGLELAAVGGAAHEAVALEARRAGARRCSWAGRPRPRGRRRRRLGAVEDERQQLGRPVDRLGALGVPRRSTFWNSCSTVV